MKQNKHVLDKSNKTELNIYIMIEMGWIFLDLMSKTFEVDKLMAHTVMVMQDN